MGCSNLVRVRRPSGASPHRRHQEAYFALDDVQAAPTGPQRFRGSTHLARFSRYVMTESRNLTATAVR